MIVLEEDTGLVGFGRAAQILTALFYADYFLLTPMRAERLQQAFYALTDLFDKVRLQMNIQNIVFDSPCSTLKI